MKILDYIFLTRPTLILPGWGFFILGYLHGLNLMGDLSPNFHIPKDPRFWIALISATLISAYIYVLNQIFDLGSDRKNDKLFLLPKGYISLRSASIFSALLAIFSFILGALVNLEFLILLFFGFLVGTLYSLPPFRFKGRPFLDMLSNAVGYAVLNLGAGLVSSGVNIWRIWEFFLPYFFAVCALYLNTTIPDIPGDREENLITTGVFLGESLTSILASFMVFLALIFSKNNPLMFWVSALSLPFYVFASFKGGKDFYAKLAYRVSGLVFTLLLIFKYPPFLIPSLLTLISLRLYYRLRFGINYPSLFGR
jgi:4-hydroxybenzoate polyprenyltransferase